MTPERWNQLMGRWHAPQSDAEFSKLKAAYSEAHRHYHTEQHIDECLAQLDEVLELVRVPEEVELALWYHDAIYLPRSSTNELDSADLASNFLRSVGAPEDRCDRVYKYILATQHIGEALSGDAAFVVDIDVSILGRGPEEYDVYEQAIRKEYRWVPGLIYRRKRIAVLESFPNRPALYGSAYLRDRYEQQARENLQRAIASLRK
jgi:predicted metal-dependent HD superfamily phosphohydrolase